MNGSTTNQDKPVLASKGKQHLVHILPRGTLDEKTIATLPGCGLDVLHTNLETGEMKVLVKTGTGALPTRRITYWQNRILGVTTDGERFYVVLWNSGRLWDRQAYETDLKGGTYRLQVYWLADGNRIADRDLTGKWLPHAAPKETTGRGPLKVETNEVTCYGTTLTFKGKEVFKIAVKE